MTPAFELNPSVFFPNGKVFVGAGLAVNRTDGIEIVASAGNVETARVGEVASGCKGRAGNGCKSHIPPLPLRTIREKKLCVRHLQQKMLFFFGVQ